LLRISTDYVGIDYSPEMIARCKFRYPRVDFRVADVRDLSDFPEGSFDLIFFSFNGIDSLDHASRIAALSEIRGLLSIGGAFVFSSHNRAAPTRAAWSLANFPLTSPLNKPRRFSGQLLRYGLGVWNALFNLRYLKITEMYELRNDEAFNYSLINYYISIEDQILQLEERGFHTCEAVALDGSGLQRHNYCSNRDPWIYYVCRG
jgi:SAM-dependent methyltransferase